MNNLRQIEAGALRELELSNLPASEQPAANIAIALQAGLIAVGSVEQERALIAASIANENLEAKITPASINHNVALQNALTMHLIAQNDMAAA